MLIPVLMPRYPKLACAVGLAVLSTSIQVAQQGPERTPTASSQPAVTRRQFATDRDAEKEPTEARIKAIKAEIAALGPHEWAGKYYCGDGMGFNILIYAAPKAGVAYHWSGCMGLYDWNYGEVTAITPEWITVALRIDSTKGPWRYMSERLARIEWGSRRFLVPDSQMHRFCNEFNSGGDVIDCVPERFTDESRLHERVSIYRRQDALAPKSFPKVPREWRGQLLPKAVNATVLEVRNVELESTGGGEFHDLTADLVMDRGADDGLLVGMELHPARALATVTLTEVDAHRSRGQFKMTVVATQSDAPVVGQKLSTIEGFLMAPEKTTSSPTERQQR